MSYFKRRLNILKAYLLYITIKDGMSAPIVDSSWWDKNKKGFRIILLLIACLKSNGI